MKNEKNKKKHIFDKPLVQQKLSDLLQIF